MNFININTYFNIEMLSLCFTFRVIKVRLLDFEYAFLRNNEVEVLYVEYDLFTSTYRSKLYCTVCEFLTCVPYRYSYRYNLLYSFGFDLIHDEPFTCHVYSTKKPVRSIIITGVPNSDNGMQFSFS